MAFLDAITCPADLRKLSMSELTELAAEMRDVIFNAVSQNGGHLASNLGVVELTIALHYVYDFGPYPTGPDRLLWGTDMPFQNRFCTYRQSRDWIEKYASAYLSADQITAIMGGTAARFLDLPSV